MRQLNFFLLLAFLSFNIHAQNTYVPDDNFEQALIDLGYDFGALDNYVPTANINSITYLNVENEGISDLTGINDFTALTDLYVSLNNLSSLDVSNNAALEFLYCTSNNLINLDLTSNTALKILLCSDNSLTRLNLVNNPFLENITCVSNDLIGINLKNGNNGIISYFNAIGNPNLVCVQVEDEVYSATNWTSIDAQTSFSDNCFYNSTTYVPDDNFEQALIDLGYDSGPLNDYVPTINIQTVSVLLLNNKAISDLTGIEDFEALAILDVSSNNLVNLDVRSNNALTNLYCHDNNLTRLNLINNQLLKILNCSYNELIGLNLRNGENTKMTSVVTIYNPDLACIQVDDPVYSATNWTSIDPSSSFSKNCRYSALYSRQALIGSENHSLDAQELLIFPNPVKDVMTISSKINGHFSILDFKGQVLIHTALMTGKTEIDLSQLEQGMYFINIKSDKESISRKIIKN